MNRRNSIIAAIIVAVFFCLPLTTDARQSSSSSSSVADTSGWKTYHDEQNSFELKYPPDWHVSSSSGSGPKMITISRPGEQKVSLTIAVQKHQNPKKLSIEDWFSGQLQRMNGKPESQGTTRFGQQPAVFMDNTNSFGKRRSIFTRLRDADVLTVIYEPGGKFEPTYEAILASFQAR